VLIQHPVISLSRSCSLRYQLLSNLSFSFRILYVCQKSREVLRTIPGCPAAVKVGT
jgi:hypothetical protein